MTPEARKIREEARNNFSIYVYDRLRFFVQSTNSQNLAQNMKSFVNDVTDVALGKMPEKDTSVVQKP